MCLAECENIDKPLSSPVVDPRDGLQCESLEYIVYSEPQRKPIVHPFSDSGDLLTIHHPRRIRSESNSICRGYNQYGMFLISQFHHPARDHHRNVYAYWKDETRCYKIARPHFCISRSEPFMSTQVDKSQMGLAYFGRSGSLFPNRSRHRTFSRGTTSYCSLARILSPEARTQKSALDVSICLWWLWAKIARLRFFVVNPWSRVDVILGWVDFGMEAARCLQTQLASLFSGLLKYKSLTEYWKQAMNSVTIEPIRNCSFMSTDIGTFS